jgi:hypothetical protein
MTADEKFVKERVTLIHRALFSELPRRRVFSKTLTSPVRYGGVMRRYPPSLWDSARAAIGCAAFLAGVLLVSVVLYLTAPYVFEWMGYVICYVQQLLGGDCTPVLPTTIQD